MSLLRLEDSLIMKLVTKMGISGGQFLNEAEQALNKLPKVSGGGQVYLTNDLNRSSSAQRTRQRPWETSTFPWSTCSYAC